MDLARVAAALLLLIPAPLALADIYAFVDENGVRHISNVQTDTRYKLVMSTPRYGGSGGGSAAATAMGTTVSTTTPRFTQNLNLGSGWRLITPRGQTGLKSAATIDLNWSSPQGKTPFSVNESNRSRFAAIIEAIALQHRLDPALLHAVISAESAYEPKAVSRAGAMGLMQLMPATARALKVADPYDAAQNVEGGVRHLRDLMDDHNGDVELSLAAYNAGAGAVQRYGGVPPYKETRNYVQRITQMYSGPGRTERGSGSAPIRVVRDSSGKLTFTNVE